MIHHHEEHRRSDTHYQRSVTRVIELSGTMSVLAIARTLGESRGYVRYWQTKIQDPDFHHGPPGGSNHSILTEEGQALAEAMLFGELQRDGSRRSGDFAIVLR